MTIDTLIQTVSDKNKTITLNSVDKLVLKKSTTPDEIISENMTDDFDVYVDAKGRINIFGITKEGTFVHTENTNNIWQTHKILERKNNEGKILGVRVLCINGNFHLFYCIDYKERILVHQVVNSGEYTMSPEVIDYVGRRFLYDVCVDDDKNLHIVYVADDDYLMYRAYTYNSKSYRNPQKICQRNIHSVRVACRENMVYSAMKIMENNTAKLCVCNVLNGSVRNAVTLAKISAETSVYFENEKFHVNWAEDSMAFEISCNEDMRFVKVAPLGKCSGLYALRAPEGKQRANFCLCNLYGEPFDKRLREYEAEKNPEYRPKGYTVEEMSQKYIDVLKAKAREIENRDFTESLSRIEASLNRLIVAVERALTVNESVVSNEKENDTWTKSE